MKSLCLEKDSLFGSDSAQSLLCHTDEGRDVDGADARGESRHSVLQTEVFLFSRVVEERIQTVVGHRDAVLKNLAVNVLRAVSVLRECLKF